MRARKSFVSAEARGQSLWPDQDGASAVEFAIVGPMLIMLLVGIFAVVMLLILVFRPAGITGGREIPWLFGLGGGAPGRPSPDPALAPGRPQAPS